MEKNETTLLLQIMINKTSFHAEEYFAEDNSFRTNARSLWSNATDAQMVFNPCYHLIANNIAKSSSHHRPASPSLENAARRN